MPLENITYWITHNENKFLALVLAVLSFLVILFVIIKPEKDDLEVKFYLFTRNNTESGIELTSALVIDKSPFNSSVKTRILIHGYNEDIHSPFNTKVRRAYLNLDRYNIVSVDWSSVSKRSYSHARRYLHRISSRVAGFLDMLKSNEKIQLKTLYLIGYDIGAHIAGVTSRYMSSDRPNTIFGLDPAQFEFTRLSSSNRLDEKDADYVETIHTAIGYYGFITPIGTASFYPNWGTMQPGCGSDRYCWHAKSYEYFAETITNRTTEKYKAKKCRRIHDIILRKKCSPRTGNRTIKMGGEPSNIGKAKGVYYILVE